MSQEREVLLDKDGSEAIIKVSVKRLIPASTNMVGRILTVLRRNRSRRRRRLQAKVHHLGGSGLAKRSRKRNMRMSLEET